jgi:predicted nucleotidyltransferase
MTAINIPKIPIIGARYAQLIQLCEHYRVEKLYVFGSVITERFNPLTSDIDLIVELQPMPPTEYGGALINLGIDLETLFERKVDLLSDQPIKNIIFKRVVERTKQLIYDRKSPKISL